VIWRSATRAGSRCIILILDSTSSHSLLPVPYTMSHSDSQWRHPIPSRSNNIHRQSDQYPYVDEEYVPPSICAERTPRLIYALHRHMRAFKEALLTDNRSIVDYSSSPSIPGSPIVPQPTGTTRIRKVSAMSDFAPVHIKVKRFVTIICEPLCGPDTMAQTEKRDRSAREETRVVVCPLAMAVACSYSLNDLVHTVYMLIGCCSS